MAKKKTARDLARQLPSALLKLDRWVPWSTVQSRGGKPTKKPDGSVSDPSHRSSFLALADTVCDSYSGVGFVFTGGILDKNGYQLISFDVDACRDPSNGAGCACGCGSKTRHPTCR
jgi:primase-polymerase (primpol)-like protein